MSSSASNRDIVKIHTFVRLSFILKTAFRKTKPNVMMDIPREMATMITSNKLLSLFLRDGTMAWIKRYPVDTKMLKGIKERRIRANLS
jgi:hypothetical protein